jgi:hypothetical protein
MHVAPRLNALPPQNRDESIINIKIAGKELIEHRRGSKMLQAVVSTNLTCNMASSKQYNADIHDKMYFTSVWRNVDTPSVPDRKIFHLRQLRCQQEFEPLTWRGNIY